MLIRIWIGIRCSIDTIPVPTKYESFSTYTFVMNASGTIHPPNTFHHVHHYFFRSGYLFAAAPSELAMRGLDTCLPVRTSETQFQTNDMLERILSASPKLICKAYSNLTWSIDRRRHFDKRPRVECVPHSFGPRDVFTSVDVWGHTGARVDDYAHEHNGWDVHYVTHDEPRYAIAWGSNSWPSSMPKYDATLNLTLGSDDCLPATVDLYEW